MATIKTIRTVFMGSPEFVVPFLSTLYNAEVRIVGVVTRPDKPSGRGHLLSPPPIKAWALQRKLPVFQPGSLKHAESRKFLNDLHPDLIIVAAFGQILPKEVLEIPRFGPINIHASLLPKYRGASPIQGAILEGERKTGVTFMLMDEGLDTGPILEKISVSITPDDTTPSLTHKIMEAGSQQLIPMLNRWVEGKIEPQKQDEDTATITRILTKKDGNIDWSESAIRIERMTRAYTPWPGAWTKISGKRLRIQKASVEKSTIQAIPGTVIRINTGIGVVCGDHNVLQLLEVQLEGKPRISGKDFLNGYPEIVTTRL